MAVLISGYRTMWLYAMFDLPVDTKAARRAYALFRKSLLQDGFRKIQYSVYARVCPSEANLEVHIKRIENHLPPDGEVRLLCITDTQFGKQKIFMGKARKQPPKTPQQLEFF